jgi:hypothetical protein
MHDRESGRGEGADGSAGDPGEGGAESGAGGDRGPTADGGGLDPLAAAVRESLAPETRATFDERVAAQAGRVADDCEAGELDNADFAVGLELEAYVVDWQGRLRAVPAGAAEAGGFGPELGKHDLELNTPPDRLDADAFDRQAARLRERLATARAAIADAAVQPDGSDPPGRVRPVLDSMWTIPPAEGSEAYLTAGEDRDGVWVATNMARKPRYHALDAATRERMADGIPLDVAGVERTFPSILVESLATSVQPHLQVPAAADLARYLRYATRILGPAVALTANSPFLPADLYPDDVDPATVLDGPHELRVPVYEDAINPPDGERKVCVPSDVADAREAVDAVVADETFAPFLTAPDEVADDDPYRQRFPEFAHKHGTFWRWVRPVFGGDRPATTDGPAPGNDDASVRLEFRPIPAQPTVDDCVACQALVAGALRGLDATDHPLLDLPRDAARESFYAAVADGPTADLAWVTVDGERTDDAGTALDGLLAVARRGLGEFGLDDADVDRWLDPLAARRDAATGDGAAVTPGTWKRQRVRDGMAHGEGFREAIHAMQREYVELSEATDAFADWL